MSAKYQVFVSSTYVDLQVEREQVIRAVLEMGHIPVGMEMFSAADEEQWKIIARQIDQSDYYVVVAAHRYGSVTDSGIGYTEKEYDYALERGVPTLGFIIKDDAPWPADRVEAGVEGRERLRAFKEKIRRKPVGFWSSAEDLHGKVSIALMKAITANPRPGWVRADGVASADVLNELSRLSRENASLREELRIAQTRSESEADERLREKLKTLKAKKLKVVVMRNGATDWETIREVRLSDVFLLVAPTAAVEMTTEDISMRIATNYAHDAVLRESWPFPKNLVEETLADFQCLGLFAPSQRKHPVADTKHYWSLTEEGSKALLLVRRVLLERARKAASPDPGAGEGSSGPA